MRGGKLRKRVNIERYDGSTRTAHGTPTRTWALVAQVWASIEPMSGDELWAAQQLNTRANTKITMRYFKGLDDTMRITYATPGASGPPRVFQIVNVNNPDERGVSSLVTCIEGKPNS